MSIKISWKHSYYLFLFSQIVLTGCTGINTLPHIARGGDTVMLAIGTAEGLSENNVSVTYTSDGGGTVDLTPNIHALFKLYADPTSGAVLDKSWTTFNYADHEPWLWTMAVNLPNTMPLGTGHINVTCTPKSACTFPNFFPHVNDVDMALEILSNDGSANPFEYRGSFGFNVVSDPAQLKAKPQLNIIPVANGNSKTVKFGAVEIIINAPTLLSNGYAVPDNYYYVLPENLVPLTRSQRDVMWKRNGDDLTIYLSSPNGFAYTETRMSIVLSAPGLTGSSTPAGIFTVPPSLTSIKYYNINGELINSGAPNVSVVLNNN
ncbi:MAG: hypothetical protein QM500_05100 [Methylococcales bacterium]